MHMIKTAFSEEEKKEKVSGGSLCCPDVPQYPHGLRLILDPNVIGKLALKEIPKIGDKMMMIAKIKVVGLDKVEGRGDIGKFSMNIQVPDLAIEKGEHKEEKKTEDVLYGVK